MARVAMSATERANRAFMAALGEGQGYLGEKHCDTAKLFPAKSDSTYYKKLKDPVHKFSVSEMIWLANRYHFSEEKICEIFGRKKM